MNTNINNKVIEIRDDKDKLNDFIEAYKPFIAATVQKKIGRFVSYGKDEELQIALIAFYEAISSYDIKKGNFISFASMIINNRLIDFFRANNKNLPDLPLTFSDTESDDEITCDINESIRKYEEAELAEYRKMEILQLKAELEGFDISLFDVANASPKQEGTKKIYKEIIKYIMQEESIILDIKNKKYLPIQKISNATGLHRKKLERARNYIITCIVVLTGEYQFIKDFINWR